ncbi:MAG: hypothetical protein ABWK00_00700 [Desulfurococcaceae archaeon]
MLVISQALANKIKNDSMFVLYPLALMLMAILADYARDGALTDVVAAGLTLIAFAFWSTRRHRAAWQGILLPLALGLYLIVRP